MAVAKVQVETLRHSEAFEYYYTLGNGRSYLQVAKKFTVSHASVKKWSKSFNWPERVKLRDIEISRKLQDKTDKEVIGTKASYRTIIHASIGEFVRQLKEKKIEVKTIWDLDKLIRLDLELIGEAKEDLPTIRIIDARVDKAPEKPKEAQEEG